MRINGLPRVGQRILRSIAGVALCFIVYVLRGRKGIPFYSALAVLQCVQPYMQSSTKMAIQRTTGTIIGAFWGLIALLLELYVFPTAVVTTVIGYFFISAMVGAVIYTTVLMNRKNVSYFSCVVFLSITVMHMTDANPFVFVLNRVADTLIGVVMAVLVNGVHLPRTHNNEILYVSGVDDALLTSSEKLTAYSKVELNRLISEGAQFTISTMRTPAFIIESLSGVNLQLPIIVMDGAALYDIQENTYLSTYPMREEQARTIQHFMTERNYHFFTNIIIDDLLVIYYDRLENDAEKKIYATMRRSPYRNYVNRKAPEEEPVVYFMMVDKKEVIEERYQTLTSQAFAEQFKIIHYNSREYPGYSYIKIYHKNATRQRMLENLKILLNRNHAITFGSIPETCDVYIENCDENQMVKELKKIYEPIKICGHVFGQKHQIV